MNVTPLLALAGLGTIGLLATRLPRLPRPHAKTLDLALAAGAPLVLAGLVLGPGIDLLTPPALQALAPITALAIGWIGAALGAGFEWRSVRRVPRATWLVAGLSGAAAFLAVLLGAARLARAIPALSAAWTPRLPAVLTLAAVAAASGPGAVGGVARAVGARPGTVRLLLRIATLETAFGALASSIPLALSRPHPLLSWMAGAGSGVLTAVLFLGLARVRPERADTGLALLATLLCGAGVGYVAGSSPFVVCAVATALIVNVSRDRHVVRRALARWERPMVAIALIVAGAWLTLPTPWILAAVALLVALRAAAVWAAARAGHLMSGEGVTRFPAPLGLGTLAQGAAAIALGLAYLLIVDGRGTGAGGPVLTTIVLSVATAQLAAPAFMKLAVGTTPAGPAAPVVPGRLTPATAAPDLSADAPAERTP